MRSAAASACIVRVGPSRKGSIRSSIGSSFWYQNGNQNRDYTPLGRPCDLKRAGKKVSKKKSEKLLKYNRAYFEKDSPIISDSEFDKLKGELLEMAKKNPFLKNSIKICEKSTF